MDLRARKTKVLSLHVHLRHVQTSSSWKRNTERLPPQRQSEVTVSAHGRQGAGNVAGAQEGVGPAVGEGSNTEKGLSISTSLSIAHAFHGHLSTFHVIFEGAMPLDAIWSRLATGVCQRRDDRMGQDPTEPRAGRSTFLLSTEWPLMRGRLLLRTSFPAGR